VRARRPHWFMFGLVHARHQLGPAGGGHAPSPAAAPAHSGMVGCFSAGEAAAAFSADLRRVVPKPNELILRKLNMLLLPPEDLVSDSIVAQLVRPEESDMIAVGIGSIGPCFTAPVFEEVLYRGFLLPALTRFFPLSVAVPLHSFIFGLHHHSLKGLLPLSALGLVWALAYVASGNLIVPIVIHAMWNARIFLSSLLLA